MLGRFAPRNDMTNLYLSSQTSSMRQPLKWLFTIWLNPLTQGCRQFAPAA
jgi:hypothetical protein